MHRLCEIFGYDGTTIKKIEEGQNKHKYLQKQLSQELLLNRFFTVFP